MALSAGPGGGEHSETEVRRMPTTEMVAASPLALVSLEDCLRGRRSRRDFCRDSIDTDDLGRLCWAGQGVTGADGLRTAPSAGGVHPLELYVVSPVGVLHYDAPADRLDPVLGGDRRPALCTAALSQDAVGLAAASIVIVAVEGRMDPRYGARARRYELIEVGHVAQNILLAATAMGVCAAPVGALDDVAVRDVLDLPASHLPVYIVAVGRSVPRRR
jgi:SagB-type dehydrogenase family enzyme